MRRRDTITGEDRLAAGEVRWLQARPVPTPSRPRLSGCLDTLDRIGYRVGRWSLRLAVGFAATAVIPGSALGPVGRAYASVETVVSAPLPPIPAESPAAPASGEGRETDAFKRLEQGRADVEDYLSFGSRQLPRRLVETIVQAADAAGVDPIYLMALADKESSFRTDVRASTSSAEGLFQFIDRTWLGLVRDFGASYGLAMEADVIEMRDGKPSVADTAVLALILELRRDPYLAAVMAAELLKRDAALIGFRIGRQLNPTELYLAHFLGLEDAARFISLRGSRKPANAAGAFPAAARANRAIFFDRGRKRHRGLSVPEVYTKIDGMIDSRVERYREVGRYAAADEARP